MTFWPVTLDAWGDQSKSKIKKVLYMTNYTGVFGLKGNQSKIIGLLSALVLLSMIAGVVKAQEAGTAPVAPAKSAVVKLKAKPVGPVECIRTGQRVIAALARDDSGAANHFHSFYEAFNCPNAHLAKAFGCLVTLQTQNPSISNPTAEQVSQCWEAPGKIPEVAAPVEAPKEGENKPK